MNRLLIPMVTVTVLGLASPGYCQNLWQRLLSGNEPSSQPKTEDAPPVTDPASPSPKLSATLEMIRRVEQYDRLVQELDRLDTENGRLQQTISKLQAELVQQSTDLPVITVASKAMNAELALAVLRISDRPMLVRQESEVLIPISQGNMTEMRVKTIAADRVELEFPSLKRTLVLY